MGRPLRLEYAGAGYHVIGRGNERSAIFREDAALSRSRGSEDKKAAIYLGRKLTRLTGREIGEAFGVELARMSNVVTELEGEGRRSLWRRAERLRRRLGHRRLDQSI